MRMLLLKSSGGSKVMYLRYVRVPRRYTCTRSPARACNTSDLL